MRILNYNWIAFSLIEEDNFFIAYFNYIDYNWERVEVSITMQYVWRDSIYVAKYNRLTTEYSWCLTEVLDKVIYKYKNEEFKRITK